MDGVANTFLGILPFYYLGKVLFLIYLFFPTTKGATVIYNKVVLPLYKQHGEAIKQKIEIVQQESAILLASLKGSSPSNKDQ